MSLLKKYRNKRGYTQKELSELSGIKITTISNYEAGWRKIPVENAKKLSEYLEIDWWKLYE